MKILETVQIFGKPPILILDKSIRTGFYFMANLKISPARREHGKKLLEMLRGAGINDVASV